MTTQQIINEFKSHGLKIISEEKLIKYVEFCLENNQQEKIKFKTSHHHILPKAKLLQFTKYSNLSENPWNGVHLLHKDHYFAHWLLSEAIEHISILTSFCAMNNKDVKLGRIKESDLIPPATFQIIMERRNKLNNERLSDPVLVKERIKKRLETITDKDLKSIGRKISETHNKEIVLENGTITTIIKEKEKKRLKTISEEVELDDGRVLTKAKIHSLKSAKTRTDKGRFFNLFHVKNGLIKTSVKQRDIKQMSQGLFNTSKENYLGKSDKSKIALNKKGNIHLIGYYIEEIL